MRINELLSEEKRTDEFIQALAPIAGAALRGAVSLGGAALRGAGAAADTIGGAVKTGAQAVGNVAKTGTNAIGTGIKNAVADLKPIMQQASGTNPDLQKLTTALATQAPGQPIDPTLMKSLQGMVPAIADALKNPNSAQALKQALTTGVKADAQQDAQQQQQQQQQPGSVGSTGSTSNTIAPTA